MKTVGVFGLLIYFSYEDIRFLKISTKPLLAGFLAAVLLLLWERELPLWQYLAGAGLGGIFFVVGIAGEHIGAGDGALLMLLGLLFGIWKLLAVLFLALLLCAVAAAVLCVLKKAKRESRLPFVPFLLGGFLLVVLAA